MQGTRGVTGRHPQGETPGESHGVSPMGGHTGRSPRGAPGTIQGEMHKSQRVSWPRGDGVMQESRGVSQRDTHGGVTGETHVGSHRERNTHRRTSMGTDSEAETHGETRGRFPWGHPRGDLRKPLYRPTVTNFHTTAMPFPPQGHKRMGDS